MRFLPTDAESKLLRQYERERRPLDQLAEEDRFMLLFSKIERLTQRMSIITFVGNFNDNVNMLTPVSNYDGQQIGSWEILWFLKIEFWWRMTIQNDLWKLFDQHPCCSWNTIPFHILGLNWGIDLSTYHFPLILGIVRLGLKYRVSLFDGNFISETTKMLI